jgi:hypothetical protein
MPHAESHQEFLETSFMRLLRFAPIALAGAVMLGCKHDITGTTTDIPPLAYVRYVHAMPDTGEVDVHLVDAVENLNFGDPSTGYTPYRTVTQYTGINAGSRHFRVFTDMQSTDINVVSQVILDTTLTLAAGTYYTIIHTGFARNGVSPHQRWVVLTDAPPTVSTSQVAVRAIVAAPFGPVDVYKTADTTTGATLPASPTFANVAYGTPTAFANFATGAAAFRAFNVGTTTPILAKVQAPAGAAQQALLDPVAGVTIGGTALTAFIFPPGVAGSPNNKITAAAIAYGVDVRPPRQ